MINYENSKERHKKSQSWFVPMIVIAFLIYVVVLVQGCQTVNGIGRDLQNMSSNYVE